ncbi:MAG: FRG domain-containing protein [Pseudomonadota bacterium]|nr:FRG domain-containing protein [Pseudomonadota bacterium]
MKGQWIGIYQGSNNGDIIVNIDEQPSSFDGIVFLHDENPQLPILAATFSTQNKSETFEFRTSEIMPINPETKLIDDWENVNKYYNNHGEIIIPKFAEVTGSWSEKSLIFSWSTNIGTHGSCTLESSKAKEPSKLAPKIFEWKEFKEYIPIMTGRKFIFRGQRKPHRLRTSFHRANRFHVHRFVNRDIQMLHKHLSGKTKHLFNLKNPDENGAFFNLVQHHGYPTPLLDWTYSPYVAAFFAFRNISSEEAKKSKLDERVRIYSFDMEKWINEMEQIQDILPATLHISIGEFLTVENERMIPQQAVSFITNIDDIESYIYIRQGMNNCEYLSAMDIPVNSRDEVIQELNYMGITAGSLFPGLDGACEELKERNFKYY